MQARKTAVAGYLTVGPQVLSREETVETTSVALSPSTRPGRPRERRWAPRIWQGMDFFAWLRLAGRNRFALSPTHSYMAVVITVVSLSHTVLRLVERLWYGRRIARTEFPEPPIFIIGHWRTGTTLLHELLALDERHTYPNTYECLEPNHFLLTEWFFHRWPRFLMPSKRPMDNMEAGWDRPQEDEFALCMMGQRSPYLTIAFPNHPPQDPEYLDLEGLSPRALASWKRDFVGFLRRVTFKKPKRLVLKSPTHSARIKVLLDLFPDARFVHIVRDPHVVFPSTVHLWKSLYRTHGLQRPKFEGLEEHVFETFLRLYDRLEEGKRLIDPSRFYELRYEDLVRDPIGQMQALYEHLGLGAFEQVRPRLEQYLAEHSDYTTNRYEIPPE
ncbi:MAG: sulfotransferase, partial [Isosphaeraceae bacterium]|nr:sulfotransferase [Isosphaeraceae bacterium]